MKELCKKYRVFLDNVDFGIMTYNEKLKRYENEYGNIPINKIILILKKDENYEFIRLENVI